MASLTKDELKNALVNHGVESNFAALKKDDLVGKQKILLKVVTTLNIIFLEIIFREIEFQNICFFVNLSFKTFVLFF